MNESSYVETFDDGPGGWWGFVSNAAGPKPLEYRHGMVISRSPWWIDYNHAPPGAGYLHMVFCLFTAGPIPEYYMEVAGPNRFVASGCSRNFVNAKITVRIKGELVSRGAGLVLLIQSKVGKVITPWALTSQPINITQDWSEQTIVCTPDESQWTCLGARYDRQDYYGHGDLREALSDVNCDILLILFPVTVAPMGEIDGDMNVLRPDKDYPVWRSHTPEGYVILDTFSIKFVENIENQN